jgi:hypothetical protein
MLLCCGCAALIGCSSDTSPFIVCCRTLQTFYVKENGVDLAAINAVEAIVSCLRNEDGYCTSPPEQGPSLRTLGF